jgi:PPM family protein phosphatase
MPLARIRTVAALPPRAAAAEVTSYWRQVEADTAARREQAGVDQGLVRARNEDAVFAGTRLFAVADGYRFGARGSDGTASSVAMECLAGLDDEPADDLLTVLGSALHEAQQAVRTFADDGDCGTTMTAMLWSGTQFGGRRCCAR